MLKEKRSNKGFTLIEVIIAISILSVVMGVGYTVINKSNFVVKEQNVITNGQMNTNLLNKYLTKDIEQTVGKIESPKDTTNDYPYVIKTREGNITYILDKSDDNKYYNIIRENTDRTKIDIVTNQPIGNGIPFTINPNSSNNNIYEVKLEYKENKINKEYRFNVAPRISVVNEEVVPPIPIEPPSNPDVDDDFESNNGFIQFGYRNKNDKLDKIWVDAGPKGDNANNKTPEPIDVSKDIDKHNINVYIRTGPANGKLDANMNENELKAEMQNNTIFKKEQNRIKISKFGDIDLAGKIKIIYRKGKKYDIVYIPMKNENHIYDIDVAYNGKEQESIEIIGDIKKPIGSKGYGEILIQFGKKS